MLRPHRRNGYAPRLAGYRYDRPARYFVTFVVHGRRPLLGAVSDGVVSLSEAGASVLAVWHELPTHYPHVVLDACVVMPDHVHAVVGLTGACREGRHGLSEIVRAWKSFSSRRINAHRGTPGVRVWQRSFYDHIVRDADDLRRIRRYIAANPARWTPHPHQNSPTASTSTAIRYPFGGWP